MLRLAALLATTACAVDALAMVGTSPALRAVAPAPRVSAPATMQFFGKKKTPEEILEAKGFWPGEWVCADCGYIYEPGTDPAFEELRPRWKCPRCAGPRRRFVKKAGDQYGELDDSALFLGTAASAF